MLPLFFIAVAVTTAGVGVKKDVDAYNNNAHAEQINQYANEQVRSARDELNQARSEVQKSLELLGREKITILNSHVHEFLDAFEQIKNVDFTDSVGLEELKNLHIDKKNFEELKELSNMAISVAGGAAAGAAGGALAAFGAWGAATTFACASTGTAISALSGAAATNATLAFFGGGSLAAGGGGMALGTAVLGGLVAGPALMVMGMVVDANASKKVESALQNKAQSDEIAADLQAASDQCSIIRRRAYMFYQLLARLDSYFLPLTWRMEDIIRDEGEDYRQYTSESKKTVACAAALAASIKAVLDTSLLNEDGSLSEASAKISDMVRPDIYADAQKLLRQ